MVSPNIGWMELFVFAVDTPTEEVILLVSFKEEQLFDHLVHVLPGLDLLFDLLIYIFTPVVGDVFHERFLFEFIESPTIAVHMPVPFNVLDKVIHLTAETAESSDFIPCLLIKQFSWGMNHFVKLSLDECLDIL